MSPTHSRPGRSARAVKRRRTRSGAGLAAGSCRVVARYRRRVTPGSRPGASGGPPGGDPPGCRRPGSRPGSGARRTCRGSRRGPARSGRRAGHRPPGAGRVPCRARPRSRSGRRRAGGTCARRMAGLLTLDELIRAQARRLVSRAREAEAVPGSPAPPRGRAPSGGGRRLPCARRAPSAPAGWPGPSLLDPAPDRLVAHAQVGTDGAQRGAGLPGEADGLLPELPGEAGCSGHGDTSRGPRHTIGCPRNRVKSTSARTAGGSRSTVHHIGVRPSPRGVDGERSVVILEDPRATYLRRSLAGL